MSDQTNYISVPLEEFNKKYGTTFELNMNNRQKDPYYEMSEHGWGGWRFKYFAVNRDFIVEVLKIMDGKTVLKCKGLPKDAVMIDFSPHYLFSTNRWAVKVWSSEFPLVPESSTMQEFEVTLSSNSVDEAYTEMYCPKEAKECSNPKPSPVNFREWF